MAYSFQIVPVLDLVRALIKASLTAQGEAPAQLPLATTTEQAAFVASDGEAGGDALPLTIIQVGTITAEEEGRSALMTLPLTVHHLRGLETGGVGAETALIRLAALATAFMNDRHLYGVTISDARTGADIPIYDACPEQILTGEDNPLQALLDLSEQSASLIAASLEVKVYWYEGQ